MNAEDLLDALDITLRKREEYWRETKEDPHNIAIAVMLVIAEIRSAIAEVISDIEEDKLP